MSAVLEHTVFPPQVASTSMENLSSVLERLGHAAIIGPDGERIDLPEQLYEVLVDAVSALANGQAVTIAPHNTVLTTQESAELLGVSRPTLVRMLQAGEIPYEQPGRHRRVRLDDLIKYQEGVRARRRTVLDEMLRESSESTHLQNVDGFVETR